MSDFEKDMQPEVEKVEEQGVEVVESQPANMTQFFQDMANFTVESRPEELLINTVTFGLFNAYYEMIESGMSTKEAITQLFFGDKINKKAKAAEGEPKKGWFGRKNKSSDKVAQTGDSAKDERQPQKNSGDNSLLYTLSVYGAEFNSGMPIDPNLADNALRLINEKGVENVSMKEILRATLFPAKEKDNIDETKELEESSDQADGAKQESNSTFADKIAIDAKKGKLPLRVLGTLDMLNKDKHSSADAMDANSGMDDDGMDL